MTMKKYEPTIYANKNSLEMVLVSRLRVKEWEMAYHANTSKEIWSGHIRQGRLQNKDKWSGTKKIT